MHTKHLNTHKLIAALMAGCLGLFSLNSYSFDDEDDMAVDRAETNDFEGFHADDSFNLWDWGSKDKKEKTVSTYEENSQAEEADSSDNKVVSEDLNAGTEQANTISASKTLGNKRNSSSNSPRKTFEAGQELRAREAYKLSNDPALSQIGSLYQAVENLHRQLNNYCPDGWEKEEEWHKPEANYFYIHYRAVCL